VNNLLSIWKFNARIFVDYLQQGDSKKPNCLCDISNGAAGAAGGEKNRTRGRPGPGVASS
jgi:hypothetical protein